MKRRDFIKGALVAGAAMSGGPRWARAAAPAPWGAYPGGLGHTELPVTARAKNVLEVFLVGGICPWETFYVVEDVDYVDDVLFPIFANVDCSGSIFNRLSEACCILVSSLSRFGAAPRDLVKDTFGNALVDSEKLLVVCYNIH